jgi:hypothetical protein
MEIQQAGADESVRDTILRSVKAAEDNAGAGGGESTGGAATDTELPSSDAAVLDASTSADAGAAGVVDAPKKDDKTAAADATGKGASDKPAPADGKSVAGDKTDKTAAAKAEESSGFKAPVSWKAPVRDKHWKTLPVEVQSEIVRREREVDSVMKTASAHKEVATSVNKLVQDFNDVFSAEKDAPVHVMHNLLGIVRSLRTSPPGQKAQHMAMLIHNFGVDVQLLDTALAGIVGSADKPDPNAGVRQIIQQELAPMREFMGNVRQRSTANRQKSQQQTQEEIMAFAQDPKNEFFDHVADDMADLMDLAAQRGQKLSLQEAYSRAILANSEIAAVVARRKIEEAAKSKTDAAAKAKELAGLSTTGSPASTGSLEEPATLRDAIVRAMNRQAA